MTTLATRAAWSLMAFLAVAVGLFSLRYVLPSQPLAAPGVIENAFADPVLAIHAGTAALALIIGAFQFLRPNRRRSPWHRTLGVAYVALCLASAPAGLVLAAGSTAGPIATAGFGMLALAWFGTTAMGLQTVLARDFAAHRRWMIRSYALTLAAVTLRIYLPIPMLIGVDAMDGYRAISFLCWIPNLMVAELWLARARRRPLTTTAPA